MQHSVLGQNIPFCKNNLGGGQKPTHPKYVPRPAFCPKATWGGAGARVLLPCFPNAVPGTITDVTPCLQASFHEVFSPMFSHFNAMQSQLVDKITQNEDSLVLSAPEKNCSKYFWKKKSSMLIQHARTHCSSAHTVTVTLSCWRIELK